MYCGCLVEDRVSVRDLRNRVSEILRRVENGDRLTVTRNRRPVADLVPRAGRRESMRWPELQEALRSVQTDAELADELDAPLPDTTDQLWRWPTPLGSSPGATGPVTGPEPDEVFVSVIAVGSLAWVS